MVNPQFVNLKGLDFHLQSASLLINKGFNVGTTVVPNDYDGVTRAKLVTGELAPERHKAVYYENFIRRICDLYGKRFT